MIGLRCLVLLYPAGRAAYPEAPMPCTNRHMRAGGNAARGHRGLIPGLSTVPDSEQDAGQAGLTGASDLLAYFSQ
jgi:hypothetical protein